MQLRVNTCQWIHFSSIGWVCWATHWWFKPFSVKIYVNNIQLSLSYLPEGRSQGLNYGSLFTSSEYLRDSSLAGLPFPLLPLLDRGGTKSTPAMLQRNCFATTITTTTTFKNNNKRNPKLLFLPTTFALFPCEQQQQDRGTSASTSCQDLETKQHMNVKSLRIYGSQESWRDVNL